MSFTFSRYRDKIVRSLSNLSTFQHGGVEGRQGGTTRLGHLPRQYTKGLSDAQYVVYCYGTPIAWVTMADDATEEGRVNFLPDWQFSATTTYYQGLVQEAWGDKVVDPNPRYSKQENRDTPRGRSSDERYGRVPRRTPAQNREAGYAPRPRRSRTTEARVRAMEVGEVRAEYSRASWPEPSTSGSRMNFAAQDDLMDEVSGYRHPSHP